MTDDEYLRQVLADQKLDPNGPERQELERHRQEVEELLRVKFGSAPALIIGGSVAKGTLIREAYDLDMHFYFPSGDTSAGETLQEIYCNVAKALEEKYTLLPKRSAIRLRCRDEQGRFTDLHIDVVPGRFIHGSSGDVFLHQNEGSKERLKTNIQTQIDHVKNSGVIDAIRLTKLWREKRGLTTKTFVLELLVIEILKNLVSAALSQQFTTVLAALRDDIDEITIQDPANPTGNNLSAIFTYEVKQQLRNAATETLTQVAERGLQSVFGPVKSSAAPASKADRLISIVQSAPGRYKPWFDREV